MTVRGWTLSGDWSGHGNFTEALEDLTSRLDNADLTVTVGRESQATSSKSQTGGIAFGLQQSDRALMPENASSPIYGKVRPGVTVQLTGTAAGSITTLLAGKLDTYSIDYSAAGYLFSASVLDGWGRPGTTKLSTRLYTGIRTGDAINIILDAVGWTGARSIDNGATVMPYWWVEGDDAASAVDKMVSAEGLPAIAYVQGNTFYFRDRHHRFLNARSVTSQMLATQIVPQGTGPGGDQKIKAGSFAYDDGLARIVNSVTFSVALRAATTRQDVWTLDSPISLAAGDVQTLVATTSDPFFAADVSLDIRSGTVTATLDRDSGAGAVITLTALSAAIIDTVRIRAQSLPVARTVTVSASDSSSIGQFGPQNFEDESPTYINQYDAQAISTRLVAVYSSARPVLTFTLVGYTDAQRAALLALQISDRITVRNDVGGINRDFVIERLVFRIRNLDLLEVEVGAQITDPGQPSNIFTFDLAGSGFNQGQFAVAGIDNAATVFRFDTAGQGFNQGVFAT